MMKKQVKKHAFSLMSMLAGGSAVLGLVYMMNELNEPPKQEKDQKHAAFKVEKKKPPKKPKRKPTRKRKAVKTTTSQPAPMPNLMSNLSGISFELPGFQSADFSSTTEKLLGDTSKKTAMTADTVDVPPKPRRQAQPAYPTDARQRGIEGYVNLRIKVSSSGSVETVRVVEAKPRGVFEETAIDSVKQWEFDPAMYQGEPVETWVVLPMRFNLS